MTENIVKVNTKLEGSKDVDIALCNRIASSLVDSVVNVDMESYDIETTLGFTFSKVIFTLKNVGYSEDEITRLLIRELGHKIQ